jgi:hypothetical protein
MQDRQAWGGPGALAPPAPGSGPSHQSERRQVDEREHWLEENAARLQEVLADPAVSVELLALLGMDDQGRQRERRLEEARRELASMELRWKLAEDKVWGT